MRLYAYYRSSASYRVRIALYHKQLPFELTPVSIVANEQQSAAHRARNPMQQVPVLELEHEGRTVQLAQSLAIIAYLDGRYPEPPLLPRDLLARARALELAEIVNAGIQPLQNSGVVRYIRDELHGDAEAWSRRAIQHGLAALAARAAESAGRFMVGDAPSIADVRLVPQLYNARRLAVALDGLDLLLRIDERARALPGWDRAHPDRQPDAVVPDTVPHGN